MLKSIEKMSVEGILDLIEEKRQEMLLSGQFNGLSSNETVMRSKELDKLIFTYQLHMYKRSV